MKLKIKIALFSKMFDDSLNMLISKKNIFFCEQRENR